MSDRTTVAFVTRRNGAWMIQWSGDHPADWPSDDQFDCASSLSVAKRIAKEGAKTFASNLRWEQSDRFGGWLLLGVEEEWGP